MAARPTSVWPVQRAGPVEEWLRGLLGEAMARRLPEFGAQVDSVDLSGGSKLGDARVFLRFTGALPERSAWRRVPEILCREPGIERVVPMPPMLHVTLGPGVLEAGVGRVAGQYAALPGRPEGPGVVVVFCSPNTNKPLHIGHLRACFLGMSVSRMLEAADVPVRRSEMLSNFGVHMCQALAMHDGVSEPGTAGLKPDWFVGELYRSYHDAVATSGASVGCDGTVCRAEVNGRPCLRCRPLELLRRMADGDPDLLAAGNRLAEWAIEGILATQARVGATYDSGLRESESLTLGVATLDQAVADGVCRRRPDGSTCIDIESTGATELTLLRSDGTSLVFSMLLAIYLSRGDRYPGWPVVELTGEQWRAGRTAMYELLRRIGRPDLAGTTEGVFFGMVQRGGAVMRSRDGSVVVADALLDRVRDRVETWAGRPPTAPAGATADRLGVSLLKYHVLGFPRADGFDFDEDAMWADATKRFGAVLRALALAEEPGESAPGPGGRRDVRTLALALARHWAVAGRALARRDPAILVRYVDELTSRGSVALPRAGPDLCAAFVRVVRGSLHLLDIAVPDGAPSA